MPASNPTYGKCSDRNLQEDRDNCGRFHFLFLAVVGGGRSDCNVNNDWYELDMLLIWPLPYMVSRTFLFYFFVIQVFGRLFSLVARLQCRGSSGDSALHSA